jgi:hypothetical protein
VDLMEVREAVSEAPAWTQQWSRRRSGRSRGRRGGGASTQRGHGSDRGGGWRGVKMDAEEEWMRILDPAAVGEVPAVGEERVRGWRANDCSQG